MSRALTHALSNEEIIYTASAAGATAPQKGVSARYSFVPTLKAVDLLREVGWLPIEVKQSGVRRVEREGYQRHLIRFMKEGLSFNGERVDLLLVNSHDRGTAFKLIASVWRQICGNGLMVASEFANFTHKHVGFDESAFADSARSIAGAASEIAHNVEETKAIELTPGERSVFAQAAHQLVYDEPEKAPINSTQLLKERRYDDKGNDLWTTFNVVQENIIKGGIPGRKVNGIGRTRRTRTRKVGSIDKDIKLNKALWTLTEKMKEIKQQS